jgi:DNA-binding MarR family transcriptional regulator
MAMPDSELLRRVDHLAIIMPQIIRFFQRVPIAPTRTPSVSLPQLRMLLFLEMEGDATMGELARWAGVTMPTATAAVNALVEGGYVSRRRSQQDRRVVLVNVTQQGRQTLAELHEERRERLRAVLSHLDADDQIELVEAFDSILRLLRKIDEGRRSEAAETAEAND